MILITGATGHYGKLTINFLLNNGVPANQIVALVRNEEKAADLKQLGIELRIGDYNDYDSLLKAFTGIEKMLFISSSDIINRETQHLHVVNAAKASGVQHVVYTGFNGKNQSESSPLWLVSKSHLNTEKWIKESGINYTILKNTLYMDFIPMFLGETVLKSGTIYLPAGDGKVGAALRAEMAEATANILSSNNHIGKTYSFANPESFSYGYIATYLTQLTGKSIQYISPTAEEYVQTLTTLGVPTDFINVLSSFAVAQSLGELDSTGSDLETLLGRKPTTIQTFLSQVYTTATNP